MILQRTPPSHPLCLFCPCVKHSSHDQKPSRDAAFTHSKDETDDEESGEVMAGGVRHQGDGPYEDVYARMKYEFISVLVGKHVPHPFTNREFLERQILWVFEGKVTEIEYGSKPGVDCLIIPSKTIKYNRDARTSYT
jgi:hypothetical protein